MRFCIDVDAGDYITGWCVLDNPNAIPDIVVVADDRPAVTVRAEYERPGIRDLGMHTTGMVGFILTDTNVHGLSASRNVEVRESTTGLLLHRRLVPDEHVERRVFYCDSSLMPQRTVTQAQSARFAVAHHYAERYGYDTLNSVFNPLTRSVICTGRISLARYMRHMRDAEFVSTVILRDPYEEFAERILFLNMVATSSNRTMLLNYVRGYEDVVDAFAAVPFDDADGLKTFFRSLDKAEAAAIANPATRLFGCEPDEAATFRSVGNALANLSQLSWVGSRSKYDRYRTVLADIIGVDIMPLSVFDSVPAVEKLAATLATVGVATRLIELDLALVSHAEEAFSEAVTG